MIVTGAGVDLEDFEVRGDPVRYRAEFDQDAVRPSTAVVATLAAVTGADPTEMEPLYDSVDTDALDAVLGARSARDSPVSVTVDVGGYEVEISSDGVVDVDPSETASPSARGEWVSIE